MNQCDIICAVLIVIAVLDKQNITCNPMSFKCGGWEIMLPLNIAKLALSLLPVFSNSHLYRKQQPLSYQTTS